MRSVEQPFEEKLKSVEADAITCVTHVYCFHCFLHRVDDAHVNDVVAEHWPFFRWMLAAHQTGFIAAMGRLYDRKAQTHRLSNLLTYAETHPGIFKRDALRQRKLAAGDKAERVQHVVSDAVEPDVRSFAELRAAMEDAQRLYEQTAQKIRHQLTAHSGLAPREERTKLFDDFQNRDREKLATVPYQILWALQQLYMNGTAPTLPSMPTNVAEVMMAKAGLTTTTWTQLQVATNVQKFVDALAGWGRRDAAIRHG
jgi:hypothetical protein